MGGKPRRGLRVNHRGQGDEYKPTFPPGAGRVITKAKGGKEISGEVQIKPGLKRTMAASDEELIKELMNRGYLIEDGVKKKWEWHTGRDGSATVIKKFRVYLLHCPPGTQFGDQS